jgi:AraC-like DNA-binding protein
MTSTGLASIVGRRAPPQPVESSVRRGLENRERGQEGASAFREATFVRKHAIPHRSSPGVLIPVLTRVFTDLRINAALFQLDHWPLVIHEAPSLLAFEIAHGAIDDRYAYNDTSLVQARKRGTTIIGRHSGFSDLFVPIGSPRGKQPVIVTGPFATTRLTSADVLDRWRSLTGRQGHPTDPEFSQYLESALETTTLDADQLAAFRRWLDCLASLMAGESAPDPTSEMQAVEKKLLEVRHADRMLVATREMFDPRTTRVWARPARSALLKSLGLSGYPESVAVGLFASARRDSDPVDDLIRRDAFQRAAVELAGRIGNAACGRLSDQGVTFVGGPARSKEQARRKVLMFAEKASALAKSRFGLRLHVGTTSRDASLPEQYQEALGAAQLALTRAASLVHAESTPPIASLTKLKRELATMVERDPRALTAGFDRYLEAVIVRTGSMLEPTRGHLEVAFDAMMDALGETSALSPRALSSLDRGVKSEASHSRTVPELAAAYRQAVRDVAGAQLDPTRAHRERSLRRALVYMRQHFAEPLTLKRVAKVGGFAPNYFSVLFRQEIGETFSAHVAALRVERAKQLLADTPLTFARVARLSGLSTPQYLSRVFRRVTGETPKECRTRGLRRRKPWH